MSEKLRLGKLLWLAVCDTRKVPRDRAELEWRDWEGDFMTKGEWQQAAELFAVTVQMSPIPSEGGAEERYGGMMEDANDLKALNERAINLRCELARVVATIKRIEDDLWRKHMAERDRAIQRGARLPSPLKGS